MFSVQNTTTASSWMQLAFTVDNKKRQVSFHQDGVLLGAVSGATNMNKNTESSFAIGFSPLTGDYFSGKIGDFKLFKTPLKDSEIVDEKESHFMPLVEEDEWTHIQVNYSEKDRRAVFYKNASKVGTLLDYEVTPATNTNDLILGRNFVGEIGDVNLFERELFESEIHTLVNDPIHYDHTEALFSLRNEDYPSMTVTGKVRGSKAVRIGDSDTISKALPENMDLSVLSAEGWIRPSTVGVTRSLIRVADASTDFFHLKLAEDNTMRLNFGTELFTETTTALSTNEWVHVAVRADKRAGSIEFYVNGKMVSILAAAPESVVATTGLEVVVGESFVGDFDALNLIAGRISQLEISDRGDIQRDVLVYDVVNTVLEFGFDEAGGALTALDNSAGANHGTVLNGASRVPSYTKSNRGMRFDASRSQQVVIPGAPYNQRDLSVSTMTAWVRHRDYMDPASAGVILKQPGVFEFAIKGEHVLSLDVMGTVFETPAAPDLFLNSDVTTEATQMLNGSKWRVYFESAQNVTDWIEISEFVLTDDYGTYPSSIPAGGGVHANAQLVNCMNKDYSAYARFNISGGYVEMDYASASFVPTKLLLGVFDDRRRVPKRIKIKSTADGTTYTDYVTFEIPSSLVSNTPTRTPFSYDFKFVQEESYWIHYAVTLDAFNRQVKMYRNGAMVRSYEEVDLPLVCSDADILIGADLNGDLDDVKLATGVEWATNFTVAARGATHGVDPYWSTGIASTEAESAEEIPASQWAHVAAVYEKHSNRVCLYHNGDIVGCYKDYLKEFSDPGTNSSNILLAKDAENYFDGLMDDVRVYDKCLTRENVKDLYKMYDPPRKSFEDDFALSFDNEGIHMRGMTLLEPRNITAGEVVDYYMFATASPFLGNATQVYDFVRSENSPSRVFARIRVEAQGLPGASSSWSEATLKSVAIDARSSTQHSLMGRAHVYVVAVYGFSKAYYTVHAVQRLSTEPLMHLNSLEFVPMTSSFSMRGTLFANQVVEERFLMAFESEDPGSEITSTQATEAEKLEALYGLARDNAHTGAVDAARFDELPANELHTLEGMALTQVFEGAVSTSMVPTTPASATAAASTSSALAGLLVQKRYELEVDFEFESTFNGTGTLSLGGVELALIKKQGGVGHQVGSETFDGVWTKYWRVETDSVDGAKLYGYRTDARNTPIWTLDLTGFAVVDQTFVFNITAGSNTVLKVTNMKHELTRFGTLKDVDPADRYNIFMLVKSNGALYRSEPFVYGRTNVFDRVLATGRYEEGTTTLTADALFPTRILEGFPGMRQLAMGNYSAAFVHEKKLYTFGRNDSGQLANGAAQSSTVVSTPTDVTSNCPFEVEEIERLLIGGQTMVAVLSSQEVWGVGYNANGQLGQGNTTSDSTWKRIPLPESGRLKQVEVAYFWIGFLYEHGEMYWTGRGCPQGNHNNYSTVQKVSLQWDAGAKIKSFCGTAVTCFLLLEDGYLYANGERYEGQLGDGNADAHKYQTKFTSTYFQPGTEDEAVALAGTHRDTLIVTKGGHLWKCGTQSVPWSNYENGSYRPNKALRGEQSSHQGKYLEEVTEICTSSSGVFVKTRADPELFYIGNGSDGVSGTGTTANATSAVRVLASPEATSAEGPYMSAPEVMFISTHHAANCMLFAFGYEIGGEVTVPPLRIGAFEARIGPAGIAIDIALSPGENPTSYYAFATVRNDLSADQARAFALSDAEGVLAGAVDSSLELSGLPLERVFDVNNASTESRNVNYAKVYVYLKESGGDEQLKSKELVVSDAGTIFANVNRVEFVPFVDRVEIDTGTLSTSVEVTKFTTALFAPKSLEGLTEAEVIEKLTAGAGTSAVQVLDSASVPIGVFGKVTMNFVSYLEVDGSVSTIEDGPRYEAATLVENADGSQSALARMRPLVESSSYYLDSVMEVDWTTITARGVKSQNYYNTDIVFTEKYCVMLHGTAHMEFFDRETQATNVSEGYKDLQVTSNFPGVTEISFSQQDMMLMDLGKSKLYIFELDDLISHLEPNTTGNVQLDLAEHLSKPYFEFDIEVGGAPHSTTDWINHRCVSKIDNNFAVYLGMQDGIYLIYVFKKGVPTENFSGWSFFQLINTEFAPTSKQWNDYRLSVKGDTIFLQPENMASSYTNGWYLIYTFVEDKFVYTDTVNFMEREVAGSYRHGLPNYALNASIYSDRYAVWYSKDRDHRASCYVARKRSSLPSTIDYKLSDEVKSGGTVVVSDDKRQLLFHSTSAAYNHVTLVQSISMDTGNTYTFEFGTKNADDTASDLSSDSANFGLCLGGRIPNSGAKGTWGVQLRVGVTATGYTFGDSEAHTGAFPNYWRAKVVKREDTGLADLRLTAYATESRGYGPVHDFMMSDLATSYSDYDGGVPTDWFQRRYSRIALMSYTTSSGNRCVYLKNLRLEEHGDIVGKWEAFVHYQPIGNGGEHGGLAVYDRFLHFGQGDNGSSIGHTLSEIVDDPGSENDGTIGQIFSNAQSYGGNNGRKNGMNHPDIYKNSLGWCPGNLPAFSSSPVIEETRRPYQFQMSSFRRTRMSAEITGAVLSESMHEVLVDFSVTAAMSNTRWFLFAATESMTERQARDLAYSGDLITAMRYGSGDMGRYIRRTAMALPYLVHRDPATGVHTPHKAAISNFGKVFLYTISAEGHESVESFGYGPAPEARAPFAAVVEASMDTFDGSLRTRVGGIAPTGQFVRAYVAAFEAPPAEEQVAKATLLGTVAPAEVSGGLVDEVYSLRSVFLADGTAGAPVVGRAYQLLVVLETSEGGTALGSFTGLRTDACFLMGLGGNSVYLTNMVAAPEIYKLDFAHAQIDEVYSFERGIFVVTKDGNCYAMGENKYNRMAFPSDHPYRNVELVESFQLLSHPRLAGKIRKVGVGRHHCMYLLTDDTLWGCGYNNYGMLATNDTATYTAPVRPYDNYEDVVDVDCSDMMSVWVTRGGDVYSVGYNHSDSNNERAQGHNNSTANSRRPRKWLTYELTGATKTLISQYQTWTLNRSGVLYTTGIAGHYRMRNDYRENMHYARRARGANNSADPISGIVDMGGGENWILLLTGTGELYAGGDGSQGTLGQNSGTSYDYPMRVLAPEGSAVTYFDEHVRVVRVGGSRYSAYAIDSTGALWSWGYNANNELGHSSGSTPVRLPRRVDTKGRVVSKMIAGVYDNYNVFVTTAPGLPTLGAKIEDLDLALAGGGMRVSLTVVPSTAAEVEWHAIVSQSAMTPAEVRAAKSSAQLGGTTSAYAGVFVRKASVARIMGHDGATPVDGSAVNDAYLYVYAREGDTESFNSKVLEPEEDPYVKFGPQTVQAGALSAELSFYSATAAYARLLVAAFDARFNVRQRAVASLRALMEADDGSAVSVLPDALARTPVQHSLSLARAFDAGGASRPVEAGTLYDLVVLSVAAEGGRVSLANSGGLPAYLSSKPVSWTYSELQAYSISESSDDHFDRGSGISADGGFAVIGGHDGTGGKWRAHAYEEAADAYTRTTEKDWGLSSGRYYARGTAISGDGERVFVTYNRDNDDRVYLWTRSGMNFTDRGFAYRWYPDGYTGWNNYHYCETDYTGDHVLCFGENRYYALLRRKENSPTFYEPVFVNHSSSAQASTYLPGSIRWGYLSHDGKSFMVYGWNGTTNKLFLRIMRHDEGTDTYRVVHAREDIAVRENNVSYCHATMSPDGRYYAVALNTDATEGAVLVYRHTGYDPQGGHVYSLAATLRSDVEGVAYDGFGANRALSFSGDSKLLLVGASATHAKTYELRADGYAQVALSEVANDRYTRISYDGGSLLAPSARKVYRVNDEPFVRFEVEKSESDLSIPSGRVVIQGEFSAAYVFAVKHDPADSAFERPDAKTELETFAEQVLAKGFGDAAAFRVFDKAPNAALDLSGLRLTKAFESFDAFGDTTAAPAPAAGSNYAMVLMVKQGGTYFAETIVFNGVRIDIRVGAAQFSATPGISVAEGAIDSSGMSNAWAFVLKAGVGAGPTESEVVAMLSGGGLSSADPRAYHEFGAVSLANLATLSEFTRALVALSGSETEAITAEGLYWFVAAGLIDSRYYVRTEFVAGGALVQADYLSGTVNDLTNYSFAGTSMTLTPTQITCNTTWGVEGKGTLSGFLSTRPGSQYYIRFRCFNGLGCFANHYLLYDGDSKLTMGGGSRSDSRSGYYHYVTTPSGGWEERSYSSNRDSSVSGWVYHSWEVVERVVTTDSGSAYANQVVKDIKINLYTSEANARALNYQGTWGYALTNQPDAAIAALQEATVPIYLRTVHATTEYIIERMNYPTDQYTGLFSALPRPLFKTTLLWADRVPEVFVRAEPRNLLTDEATRAVSYDSMLLKTTEGGFDEAHVFVLAEELAAAATPEELERFVEWTVPFATYPPEELLTVPRSTDALTALPAGSFAKGFVDWANPHPRTMAPDAAAAPAEYRWVNVEIKSVFLDGLGYNRPYTLRAGELGLYGAFSAVDTDAARAAARDSAEDVRAWVRDGAEGNSAVINSVYDGTLSGQLNGDPNFIAALEQPNGSSAQDGSAYTISPSDPSDRLNLSFKLSTAVAYISQITVWVPDNAPFGSPAELIVYFGNTREEAESKQGAFQTIDLTHLRSELTVNATPRTLQIDPNGDWAVGSATTGPEFAVTGVQAKVPRFELVTLVRKDDVYYMRSSRPQPRSDFDPALEAHLTAQHLSWSAHYDSADSSSHPAGYTNALFPAQKNCDYQSSANGRGAPWAVFNEYYAHQGSSLPEPWGSSHADGYAYFVVDMGLYPGNAAQSKVYSRAKVWTWNEGARNPSDLAMKAADSLDELVSKPLDGELMFEEWDFRQTRDAPEVDLSTTHQSEYTFPTPLVGRYLLVQIWKGSDSFFGLCRLELYGHDFVPAPQLSWGPVLPQSPARVELYEASSYQQASSGIVLASALIKTKPAGFDKAYVLAVKDATPAAGKSLEETAILAAESEAPGVHVFSATPDALVDLAGTVLAQAFDTFLAPATAASASAAYTTIVVVKKGAEYVVAYGYP